MRLKAVRITSKQEAADLEERKMEVVRREMGLARQLKDAKARAEELTAMVASERVKRQQSEASLAQEIDRLNQAWRKASAQKGDASATLASSASAIPLGCYRRSSRHRSTRGSRASTGRSTATTARARPFPCSRPS